MSPAVPGRTCIRPTAPAGLTASARKSISWMMWAKASAGSTRQPLSGVQSRVGIAVGGVDPRARLAVVGQPELRAGKVEPLGDLDQRVMLRRAADLRLVAEHLLGQAALADRRPARVARRTLGSAATRLDGSAVRGAGRRVVHAERLARQQAVEAFGRARRGLQQAARPRAAGGRPAPRAPPNKPRGGELALLRRAAATSRKAARRRCNRSAATTRGRRSRRPARAHSPARRRGHVSATRRASASRPST